MCVLVLGAPWVYQLVITGEASVSGVCVLVLGVSWVHQLLIEKRTSLDPKRLAVTSALGFLLVGPTLHFW